MRKWLVCVVLAFMFMVGCGGGSDVTTPSDPALTIPTPKVEASPSPSPSPEATAPGKTNPADIDDAGTVTGVRDGATVCIYAWPAQDKVWNSYQVKGTTYLQKPNGYCSDKPLDVQVDVQQGAVCPTSGFANAWDGFIKGRSHVTVPAVPCPKPTPTPPPPPCTSCECTNTCPPPPPVCTVDEKLVDGKCKRKTCKADGYQCPTTCEYTIDCGQQDDVLASGKEKPNYCVNHSEQAECAAGHGVWSYQSQGSKCVVPSPGISNRRWQLNPGQSDSNCLDKRD